MRSSKQLATTALLVLVAAFDSGVSLQNQGLNTEINSCQALAGSGPTASETCNTTIKFSQSGFYGLTSGDTLMAGNCAIQQITDEISTFNVTFNNSAEACGNTPQILLGSTTAISWSQSDTHQLMQLDSAQNTLPSAIFSRINIVGAANRNG